MEIFVVPLNFSDEERADLDKAVNSFTSVQKLFEMQMSGPSEIQPDKNDQLNWQNLKSWLTSKFPNRYVIAVTSLAFDDNWFSHTEKRVAAITTHQWRRLFSPPGPHCYLLGEFATSCFFFSSNLSEMEAGPHPEPIGCILDLCEDKRDIRWYLRVGHICPTHMSNFRMHGGSDEALEAIRQMLEEVRRVTLDIREAGTDPVLTADEKRQSLGVGKMTSRIFSKHINLSKTITAIGVMGTAVGAYLFFAWQVHWFPFLPYAGPLSGPIEVQALDINETLSDMVSLHKCTFNTRPNKNSESPTVSIRVKLSQFSILGSGKSKPKNVSTSPEEFNGFGFWIEHNHVSAHGGKGAFPVTVDFQCEEEKARPPLSTSGG